MIIESVTGEAPPSEHVDTVFSLVDADVRLNQSRLGDSSRTGSFLTACCCAFAELGAGELQGGRGLLRHRREPQRLGGDWYSYMQ